MKHLSDKTNKQKKARWSPFSLKSALVFTEVCGPSLAVLQGFRTVVLGLSSSLMTCGNLVSPTRD